MRAIINECTGYGNISIVKEVENFNRIIEYASTFEVSLLCIDDLDLLIGSREDYRESKGLKGFLEALDGIVRNNVFILSTTHDKKLVDLAAKRPGRLNSILDFANIEKKYYRKLIERAAEGDEAAEFITDELLECFAVNDVTGSFIVNFVKNIIVMKKFRGSIKQEDVMEYFSDSFKGFYRKADKGRKIGFKKD